MARRSRSLNELPGHLRVPILKRRDTERTQARLEAGLAGMEELRVLRERQEQLVGDTVARATVDHHASGRRQHRHHHRRHGDNRHDGSHHHHHQCNHGDRNNNNDNNSGSSSSNNNNNNSSSTPAGESSKILRTAAGPAPVNSYGLVSSWQSASSLASISEEGDSHHNALFCGHVDKTNNSNNNSNNHSPLHCRQHGVMTHSDNNADAYSYPFKQRGVEDNIAENTRGCHEQLRHHRHHQETHHPVSPASSNGDERVDTSTGHSDGHRGQSTDTRRCRWSQEDLDQPPMTGDQVHTSPHMQKSNVHVSNPHKHRRSVSVTTDSRTVRDFNVMSCSRRYSTSMINDSQKQRDCTQSKSKLDYKGSLKSGHNPRSPLSSISNFHAESSDGQQRALNSHGPTSLNKQNPSLDAHRRHMSWDNLLKTIGISSSTSSLSCLDDDVMSDTINDNVFGATESRDNCIEKQQSRTKAPLQKIGRSFSFSYGNGTDYSKRPWQACHERSRSTYVDECVSSERADSSLLPFSHAGEAVNPIMRRASLQCEAVLTNSNVARRIVNPIHDVDINRLTSPGPVHAVMLQYTSRETGSMANAFNDANLSSYKRQSKNDRPDDIRDTDSEHQLLRAPVRDGGRENRQIRNSQRVPRETEPNAAISSKNDLNHCGKIPQRINDKSTNSPSFSGKEFDIDLDLDVQTNVLNQTEQSKKNSHYEREALDEKATVINQSINDTCLNGHTKDDSTHAVNLTSVEPRSKVNPIHTNVWTSFISVSGTKQNPCRESNDDKRSSSGTEFSEKESAINRPQLVMEQTSPTPSSSSSCQNLNELSSKNGNAMAVRTGSDCDFKRRRTNLEQRPDSRDNQKSRVSPSCESTSQANNVGSVSSSSVDRLKTPCILVATDPAPSKLAGMETKDIDKDMKHDGQNDMRKVRCSLTSSDVSVISDEGYSTCDSVGPLSKRNRSSIAESISSVLTSIANQGDLTDSSIARQDDKECESTMCTTIPNLSDNKPPPGKKSTGYDNVAVLEQGAAIVCKSEYRNISKKSLHRPDISSKSFKQTAV